jgi:hypothetical protein
MKKQVLRRILPIWALLAAAALLPADGHADGISISGELEYLDSKEDRKEKSTGEEIDTDLSKFLQLYNIELTKQIFPYVRFRSGVVLERTNTRITADGDLPVDDARVKRTDRTRTYFFETNLGNPAYSAGLTYRDTEDKIDGTISPDRRIFRDEYVGFLRWRPERLPSVSLNYRHTDTHDKPRTRDTRNELLNLNSEYYWENLGLDYTYTRTDVDEKIEGFGQLDQLHDVGTTYSTSLLGGRVSLDAGSELLYRVSDPDGGRKARLPTAPSQGIYYLLDDSPPESNTAGEFTTVSPANPLTNVDIGPSGPPNLVSFGVEFASPTQVDVIYVLPLEDASDPSLATPGEIDAVANLFTWQVFASDDQEIWTELNVTGATYALFENRFEISFSSPVDAEFFKVVTQPLSGGTTRSILISQLQTLETVQGSEGATLRSFRQIYDLGLRSDLTPDTTATYEFYYRIDDQNLGAGKRKFLTNGLGLRHVFSPKLVGHTRYMRTVTRRPDNDGVQNNFSAALRADHLDTFYQTLTYSALYSRDDDASAHTHTLWMRNNAELHPDWSVNLDFGFSRNSPADGETSSGALIRFLSNLRPNQRANVYWEYRISWTKEKHQGTRRAQRLDLRGFLVPTDVLSLVANIQYNDDGVSDHRLSQDYSVRWAPFPDGDLDLSVTYRRFENREGRKSDTITPEARWQIRRGLLGLLSYTIGSEESENIERDIRVLRAELRFSFR